MKPETHENWEKALSHFKNAEKLLKDEKFNEAEEQARFAVFWGFDAMLKLSKELEMDDLNTIAWNVLNEGAERGMKGHYPPKENIEWSRKILKRFTAELPPDTLRPFR